MDHIDAMKPRAVLYSRTWEQFGQSMVTWISRHLPSMQVVPYMGSYPKEVTFRLVNHSSYASKMM